MRVKRSCLLEDWRSRGQKVVGWKLGHSDLVVWGEGKGNQFWDTIFQGSGNTRNWAWLASEGAREANIGTKYHWNLMKSKASPWLQPPFRSGALTAHHKQRGDGRGGSLTKQSTKAGSGAGVWITWQMTHTHLHHVHLWGTYLPDERSNGEAGT